MYQLKEDANTILNTVRANIEQLKIESKKSVLDGTFVNENMADMFIKPITFSFQKGLDFIKESYKRYETNHPELTVEDELFSPIPVEKTQEQKEFEAIWETIREAQNLVDYPNGKVYSESTEITSEQEWKDDQQWTPTKIDDSNSDDIEETSRIGAN